MGNTFCHVKFGATIGVFSPCTGFLFANMA